jgi:hypothetical protein
MRLKGTRRSGTLTTLLAALLLCCAGCAGPAYTVYNSDFAVGPFSGAGRPFQGFPIERIGVCGPFSAQMTDTFAYAGYPASDLGDDASLCPDKAEDKKLRYVAVCELERDDNPGIGMEYNMFVVDMETGDPLWREEGEETGSGSRIRKSQGLDLVMRDMVNAFAKIYPPAQRRETRRE